MKVYRSNRVEKLLDALVDVVSEPLRDPMQDECVVVNSRGMGTWLSMQLATRVGVWAGASFVFPGRFFDEFTSSVVGTQLTASDRDRWLWSILRELPSFLHEPAFADLRRFVSADPTGRNSFQLARRIAACFEQYAVFRPSMVLDWDRGAGSEWQPQLWRAVQQREPDLGHAAARAKALVDGLRGAPDRSALPDRISLFGLSTLPPFYLELLDAIDKVIPVHLFVVSPSREYWAEIRSSRELLRQPEEQRGGELEPDAGLLSAFGGVGRDFQRILESTVDYEEPPPDRYVDPGDATMLAALQSDLLHFRVRRQGSEFAPYAVRKGDASVRIHACHSPMREVEVLHDQLLDALDNDPSLQPRDIVVLLPDVETYAPLVEAVFERDIESPTFIPFCVSDRTLRADSPLLEALHRILDLVGGRVTASEVLDIIALRAVAERFAISADDIDTIGVWVAESGIRWGIDGAHRKQHGQPKREENTWRFGLQRLLLGYAMPGSQTERFAGVLPYDELEGQQTALLGTFVELCERLFALATDLDDPRTPRQWQIAIGHVVDRMLAGPAEAEHDVQALRAVLETIASEAEAACFDAPLGLFAMRELIDQRLEDRAPVRGFLAGGVTFCAMLPMRSVPFDVVCMVGLGDADFPRGQASVGFDLIAQHPKAGDRSRRADDRYLFLEALLCARKRVLLSYVGQSIQDNSDIPPSVVVSELLDELALCCVPEGHTAPDANALRASIVVEHAMQPFSPRYFGTDADPRLFSYAADYRSGAEALLAGDGQHVQAQLLTEPLPDPRPAEATEHVLSLAHLVRFFRMPAADLVKRRLGIYLEDFARDLSDREPMELDGLEEWRIGSLLLDRKQKGTSAAEALDLARAAGELPLGAPGAVRFASVEDNVGPLLARLAEVTAASPLPLLEVDLAIGTTRLVGTLGGRWPAAMATVQYAKVGAKHTLSQWIQHLALCSAAPADQEHRSVLVGRSKKGGLARSLSMRAPAKPGELLADLIDLYWIGQTEPLLLFPRCSLAFATTFADKRDADAAFEAARRPWSGRHGEGEDPHLIRLFRDREPLEPGFSLFDAPMRAGDFSELAIRVFAPLLEHTREE